MECKHEWGTYKNGRNCLHCADCGVELDMITRQPIKKDEKEEKNGANNSLRV